MKSDEAEAGIFRKTERDIHRLHSVAGSALHQVVDRAERDDAVAARIEGEADVGEVRSGDELRLGEAVDARALLDDAHERLARVRLPIRAPERLLVAHAAHRNVRG